LEASVREGPGRPGHDRSPAHFPRHEPGPGADDGGHLASVYLRVYTRRYTSGGDGVTGVAVPTDQIEYSWDELLADPPVAEPLFAGGVRCHGGFSDDGTYLSPRTRHRVPAIAAWQARHTATFG